MRFDNSRSGVTYADRGDSGAAIIPIGDNRKGWSTAQAVGSVFRRFQSPNAFDADTIHPPAKGMPIRTPKRFRRLELLVHQTDRLLLWLVSLEIQANRYSWAPKWHHIPLAASRF